MKTKRFRQYLDNRRQGNPIRHKNEVAGHSDQKIDEDFKGFPGSPSKEKVIKPQTTTEKKTAAVNVKDGEKMEDTSGKNGKDEQYSEGSGGAFGATEELRG